MVSHKQKTKQFMILPYPRNWGTVFLLSHKIHPQKTS